MAKPVFTIGHYAGEVTYVIDEFLDKNRDSLSDDMLELLSGSRCELVRHLGDRGYMSVKEREDRNNQLQNMAMMTANAGIKKSNVASPPAMTRKPRYSLDSSYYLYFSVV
jgi:myosin heavy subunit